MRLHIIAGGLAVMLTTAGAASAAPFTNGSFETFSTCDPSGGFAVLPVGDTCVQGWEVVQNPIDFVADAFWEASDPDKSIDLNGDSGPGGIQQTFDTVAGQPYQVRFDLSGNPFGDPNLKILLVSAGANSSLYAFDATGNSHTEMGWVLQSFVFTAISTTTTLQFLSTTELCCFGPAIDNVRVSEAPTLTAVPEPATLVLLGSGLLAIGRTRSRRSKSVGGGDAA